MAAQRQRNGSSSSTSRSLIERIRGNDGESWDRIVSLYAPLVYKWCQGRGLQDQDIADIVQEVFQAVAVNISKFRKDRPDDTFRGWLRIITRNKIHDKHRKRGREPEGVGGTEAHRILTQMPSGEEARAPDGEGGSETVEESSLLDRALFQRALELIRTDFHPRTWKAFIRTAVDEQPPKEVAEELSMTPGAVRVAKSRVLHRLRQELGDLMD